jgi:hypothetical protein
MRDRRRTFNREHGAQHGLTRDLSAVRTFAPHAEQPEGGCTVAAIPM